VCFGALEKNTMGHWNPVVGGLTINVRKMLQEMDPELFEQCHKRWLEDQARHVADEKARRELWSRVEKLAIINSP
jgi:serine/threonine-protein phosphatase 2A regulatory subunit B'